MHFKNILRNLTAGVKIIQNILAFSFFLSWLTLMVGEVGAIVTPNSERENQQVSPSLTPSSGSWNPYKNFIPSPSPIQNGNKRREKIQIRNPPLIINTFEDTDNIPTTYVCRPVGQKEKCLSDRAKVMTFIDKKWCCMAKKFASRCFPEIRQEIRYSALRAGNSHRSRKLKNNNRRKPGYSENVNNGIEIEPKADSLVYSNSTRFVWLGEDIQNTNASSSSIGSKINLRNGVEPTIGIVDQELQEKVEDNPGPGPEPEENFKSATASKRPSAKLSVYAYNNFGEPKASFDLFKDCMTLPEDWRRRISSVNTHGTCVEICQYKNCGGRCLRMAPGTPGHNRLRDINFDKIMNSIRPCNNN